MTQSLMAAESRSSPTVMPVPRADNAHQVERAETGHRNGGRAAGGGGDLGAAALRLSSGFGLLS